ncbi:protein CHUP1, chloroplastic-like isoform X2 [Quercus robur]|nr:protein CHUP1, chloroplastic-like isoform X2 [Quercus robur]
MVINKMKQNLKARKRGSGDFKLLIPDKELSIVIEKGLLQSLEKELEQRKAILERKLFEYYGLKERQSHIGQLQRQLEDKTTEINMRKMAADSLQDERKKLHEEIKQGLVAEKQLEKAKKMLKGLQEKMDASASNVNGSLIVLQEQVSGFQSGEISFRDNIVEKELEDVKDVELEIAEMQRRKRELELEKRELAVKLIAAKERIAALSNMKESKIIAGVKEEVITLRHANKELQERVERLQSDRFDMVEELVYQRWIRTCLRLEIQNQEKQLGKTSKCDSRKDSSKKSHEKTKPVMSDPGFGSIFSSSSTESDEMVSTTIDSSSSSQRSCAKRLGVIQNIKRWGRSKDDSSTVLSHPQAWSSRGNSLSSGLFRRFSLSIIPSNTPMRRTEGITPVSSLSEKIEVHDSNKSLERPTFQRPRRVSFNDSVKSVESTYRSTPKSVEGMLDGKEISAARFGHSSNMNSGPICSNKIEGVKHEPPSATLTIVKDGHSSGTTEELNNNDSINLHVGRTEIVPGDKLHSMMSEVLPLDNRDRSHALVNIVAALFFIFVLFRLSFC